MAEIEKKPPALIDTPGAGIPALFSNRFYIYANAQTTRIVFSEGLGGETINSHTAIVMPSTDAAELARLLTELTDTVLKPPPPSEKEGSNG